MADNFNININNYMGSRRNSSQNKLSAKGSMRRKNNAMQSSSNIKKPLSTMKKAAGVVSSGKSSAMLSKAASKGGMALGVIGLILAAVDKVGNFGLRVAEAQSGNVLTTNNAKFALKTVSSFGLNIVGPAIQNEIFTKKIIDRQNYGLEYGRELYDINVNGNKYKKI